MPINKIQVIQINKIQVKNIKMIITETLEIILVNIMIQIAKIKIKITET